MAAVDLLFQVRPNAERMHQLTLSTLLSRTELCRHLGIAGTPEGSFEWEPERRLYDLRIPMRGGGALYVEIRLDSGLQPAQVRSQVDRLRKLTPGQTPQLLYLVLGATRFVTDRKQLLHMVGTGDAEAVAQGRVHYCDSAVLTRALRELVGESPHADSRDLAAAYITCLRGLTESAARYAQLAPERWAREHYLQFFEHLRARGIAAGADFDAMSSGRGGGYGCWWGWTPLIGDGDPEAYVQLELGHEDLADDRMTIKVRVLDEAQRLAVRDAFQRALFGAPRAQDLNARRPARLGVGAHMTVAELPFDLRQLRQETDMAWDQIRDLCAGASRLVDEAVRHYRQGLIGRK